MEVKLSKIFLLLLLFTSCSQTKITNKAKINFTTLHHDFGEMEYKSKAGYGFVFKNSGSTPLLIQNVTTSCGCAVPEWHKKPLLEGESSQVSVKYDTKYPGRFHKTIKVFFNGPKSPVVLKIMGSVMFSEKALTEN